MSYRNHTFLGEDLILITYFGSRLFGTSTENSDVDIKGIFIPTTYQILMNKIPEQYLYSSKEGLKCPEDAEAQAEQLLSFVCRKTGLPYVHEKKNIDTTGIKNTKNDFDIELMSIHKFMRLAYEGDTMALDMLNTTGKNIIHSNLFWGNIVLNRQRFYTKDLTKFVEYCRKQAARYGIKGFRVHALKEFLEFLESKDSHLKLREFWDEIKENEYVTKKFNNTEQFNMIYVCGKCFHETVRVSHVLPIIQNYYKEYGSRAIQASLNEGVDWKAVSHAIRAAYEIKEILMNNRITFPLEQAGIVRDVKLGKMDFTTEVAPLLESLAKDLEVLALDSELPQTVDKIFVDRMLLKCTAHIVKRDIDEIF